MKKLILALSCLMLLFGGYLFLQKKLKMKYRFDPETGLSMDGLKYDLEQEKEKNAVLSKSLDSLKVLSDISDTDTSEIQSLKEENAELRRQLAEKEAVQIQPNKTKTNEKNLPIARNSRAIELQRFLTDTYGNR